MITDHKFHPDRETSFRNPGCLRCGLPLESHQEAPSGETPLIKVVVDRHTEALEKARAYMKRKGLESSQAAHLFEQVLTKYIEEEE